MSFPDEPGLEYPSPDDHLAAPNGSAIDEEKTPTEVLSRLLSLSRSLGGVAFESSQEAIDHGRLAFVGEDFLALQGVDLVFSGPGVNKPNIGVPTEGYGIPTKYGLLYDGDLVPGDIFTSEIGRYHSLFSGYKELEDKGDGVKFETAITMKVELQPEIVYFDEHTDVIINRKGAVVLDGTAEITILQEATDRALQDFKSSIPESPERDELINLLDEVEFEVQDRDVRLFNDFESLASLHRCGELVAGILTNRDLSPAAKETVIELLRVKISLKTCPVSLGYKKGRAIVKNAGTDLENGHEFIYESVSGFLEDILELEGEEGISPGVPAFVVSSQTSEHEPEALVYVPFTELTSFRY